MPVWNPDLPDPIDYLAQWTDVPDNQVFDNGFKAQWELFLTCGGRPARRSAGIWPRAPRACSWPGWRSSRRRKAAGSSPPLALP